MDWEKAKNKEKYILIPIYAVAYLISYLNGVRCIWKTIFGISCPGCGFTRAVICMLKMDFEGAWHFHPMYWSFFVLVLLFIFEGNIFPQKIVNRMIICLLILGFSFVWIYRLIYGVIV